MQFGGGKSRDKRRRNGERGMMKSFPKSPRRNVSAGCPEAQASPHMRRPGETVGKNLTSRYRHCNNLNRWVRMTGRIPPAPASPKKRDPLNVNNNLTYERGHCNVKIKNELSETRFHTAGFVTRAFSRKCNGQDRHEGFIKGCLSSKLRAREICEKRVKTGKNRLGGRREMGVACRGQVSRAVDRQLNKRRINRGTVPYVC